MHRPRARGRGAGSTEGAAASEAVLRLRDVVLGEVAAGRGVGAADPPAHRGHVAVRPRGVVAGLSARRSEARAPRTSSGSAAISRANRCRRAISNATCATSHGRRGGVSGRSIRPTWSTKISLAPAATASPIGIELTMPPSTKCSPPISRRRQQARHDGGREHRRRPADPLSNQCSAARSMLAAQHRNGIFRSANVRALAQLALQQPAQRHAASAGGCGRRTGAAAGRPSRRTPRSPPGEAHSRTSRSVTASVGSAATSAPLTAPIDVPTHQIGLDRRPGTARAACRPRRRRARRHRRARTPPDRSPPHPVTVSPARASGTVRTWRGPTLRRRRWWPSASARCCSSSSPAGRRRRCLARQTARPGSAAGRRRARRPLAARPER